MPTLPGVKFTKNAKGKITHVTISRKQNYKLVDYMIDAGEIRKARKDISIPWEVAKERLLNRKAWQWFTKSPLKESREKTFPVR